jgi:tetratricopeptide (TPR) repeat protein
MDARIKDVEIELSNGWKKNVKLKDHGTLQFFELSNKKSDYIKLTIKSLYPRTRWSHECMSEILIFAKSKIKEKNDPLKETEAAVNNIKDKALLKNVKRLQKDIASNPTKIKNYLDLGQIYIKAGLYFEALTTTNAAISIDPDNGEAYYLKSMTHILLGEKSASVSAISKSMDIFLSQKKEMEFKKALDFLNKLKEADKDTK